MWWTDRGERSSLGSLPPPPLDNWRYGAAPLTRPSTECRLAPLAFPSNWSTPHAANETPVGSQLQLRSAGDGTCPRPPALQPRPRCCEGAAALPALPIAIDDGHTGARSQRPPRTSHRSTSLQPYAGHTLAEHRTRCPPSQPVLLPPHSPSTPRQGSLTTCGVKSGATYRPSCSAYISYRAVMRNPQRSFTCSPAAGAAGSSSRHTVGQLPKPIAAAAPVVALFSSPPR